MEQESHPSLNMRSSSEPPSAAQNQQDHLRNHLLKDSKDNAENPENVVPDAETETSISSINDEVKREKRVVDSDVRVQKLEPPTAVPITTDQRRSPGSCDLSSEATKEEHSGFTDYAHKAPLESPEPECGAGGAATGDAHDKEPEKQHEKIDSNAQKSSSARISNKKKKKKKKNKQKQKPSSNESGPSMEPEKNERSPAQKTESECGSVLGETSGDAAGNPALMTPRNEEGKVKAGETSVDSAELQYETENSLEVKSEKETTPMAGDSVELESSDQIINLSEEKSVKDEKANQEQEVAHSEAERVQDGCRSTLDETQCSSDEGFTASDVLPDSFSEKQTPQPKVGETVMEHKEPTEFRDTNSEESGVALDCFSEKPSDGTLVEHVESSESRDAHSAEPLDDIADSVSVKPADDVPEPEEGVNVGECAESGESLDARLEEPGDILPDWEVSGAKGQEEAGERGEPQEVTDAQDEEQGQELHPCEGFNEITEEQLLLREEPGARERDVSAENEEQRSQDHLNMNDAEHGAAVEHESVNSLENHDQPFPETAELGQNVDSVLQTSEQQADEEAPPGINEEDSKRSSKRESKKVKGKSKEECKMS